MLNERTSIFIIKVDAMLKKVVYSLLAALLLTGLSVQAFQSTLQTVTVTARYLNLRQGPSTNTPILAVIRAGETYPVLAQSGTWWQISVGNISGFVSGRYVKANDGVPVPATPEVMAPTATACSNTMFFSSTPSDVCTGPIAHTQAAYQTYQNGFMIWLADSGDIWAFMNAPSGLQPPWMHIPQNYYAGLADATGPAPAGLVQQINGFGRLWGSYHGVNQNKLKDELGWATAAEISYNATWQLIGRAMHVHTYMTVPDGRVAHAYSGLAGYFWSVQ
jgi:hypothetical protein